MTPSIKFSVIAWVAITGLSSLPFFLRDKTDKALAHHLKAVNNFAMVPLFTLESYSKFPLADELIAKSTLHLIGDTSMTKSNLSETK
jgi:hypothetical protein